MIQVLCEWCGKKFGVKPARKDRARFCSRECKGKWWSENFKGEKNPNYGGGKEVKCEICGKTFWKSPSHVGRACSDECKRILIGLERRKEIPDSARGLSKEKAYVLSVLGPGDGNIMNNRTVRLSAKDFDFVNHFASLLEDTYGVRTFKKTIERKDYATQLQVLATSIEMVDDLLSYGKPEHFKHGTEKVPDEVMEADQGKKLWYLRGFFDSQGDVNLSDRGQPKVRGSKKNKDVLRQIGELLSDLGVEWKIYGRITVHRLESVEKLNEIGIFTMEKRAKKLEESLREYKARRKSVRTPPDRIDSMIPKMREMRDKGMSSRQIGKELGIAGSAVLRRIGGFPSRKKWTKREDEIIRKHYPEKGSDIPGLERTRSAIKQRARKLGVEFR